MQLYYFMRSTCGGSAWPTKRIRTLECCDSRWADIRELIAKELQIDTTYSAYQTQRNARQRTYERQSLVACVVHNMAHPLPDASQLMRRASKLPPLSDGSLLLDGDVLILARVPYSATLYTQDILHRFWLVCTMREHFEKHWQELRTQKARAAFQNCIETYNLPLFAARLEAISTHKKKQKYSAIEKNKDYRALTKDLLLCFDESRKKYCERLLDFQLSLFDFTRVYCACFGEQLMQEVIRPALQNVCIDIDRRTHFLARILYESGSGTSETGLVLARRLKIVDNALIALVRDVEHVYEAQQTYAAASPPITDDNDSVETTLDIGALFGSTSGPVDDSSDATADAASFVAVAADTASFTAATTAVTNVDTSNASSDNDILTGGAADSATTSTAALVGGHCIDDNIAAGRKRSFDNLYTTDDSDSDRKRENDKKCDRERNDQPECDRERNDQPECDRERDEQPKKMRKTEDDLIRQVIADAAMDGALIGSSSNSTRPDLSNFERGKHQRYCVACDVPGHATRDCPRKQFMETLRKTCQATPEQFYSPESGICPSQFSQLVRCHSKYFVSKAGVLNRQKVQRQKQKKYMRDALPWVPDYDLRWIAD